LSYQRKTLLRLSGEGGYVLHITSRKMMSCQYLNDQKLNFELQ